MPIIPYTHDPFESDGWPIEELALNTWAHQQTGLTYDDITFGHDLSGVESRGDLDTSVTFDHGLVFSGPLVTSPMADVTWWNMAKACADLGLLGCVHRMPLDEWFGDLNDPGLEQILTSLTREDKVRAVIKHTTEGFNRFLGQGFAPDQVCMSVSMATYQAGHVDKLWEIAKRHGRMILLLETANGFTEQIFHATRDIVQRFDGKILVGAGNFTTGRGVCEFAEIGGRFIRGPIGPGRLCKTRRVAGVGYPSVTFLAQTAYMLRKRGLLFRDNGKGVIIIQDGGTHCPADRVKAIVAGADMTMGGTSLAPLLESGAQYIETREGKSGRRYVKVCRGSASEDIVRSVRPLDYGLIAAEGEKVFFEVDPDNPFTLKQYWQQLRSAYGSCAGYWNASNLAMLRCVVRGCRVTSAGNIEGMPTAANGTSRVNHF